MLLFYLKKFLRRHHMVRENGTDHKMCAKKNSRKKLWMAQWRTQSNCGAR